MIGSSSASTVELFARLALSLAVVLGLMWAIATVLRRRGVGAAPRRRNGGIAPELELLARKPLGRNASVAIVRAGNQAIVIGVTDHQITKLADTEIPAIDLDTPEAHWTAPPPGTSGSGSAWKTMLDQMRERTVRR